MSAIAEGVPTDPNEPLTAGEQGDTINVVWTAPGAYGNDGMPDIDDTEEQYADSYFDNDLLESSTEEPEEEQKNVDIKIEGNVDENGSTKPQTDESIAQDFRLSPRRTGDTGSQLM